MQPSDWIAIVAVVIPTLLVGIGAAAKIASKVMDNLRRENEQLKADLKAALTANAAQLDTINTLKLQVNKLEITASLQEKFFGDLHRKILEPGDKDPSP